MGYIVECSGGLMGWWIGYWTWGADEGVEGEEYDLIEGGSWVGWTFSAV
jgi:hypothetical protein